jgi:hypothetical protein
MIHIPGTASKSPQIQHELSHIITMNFRTASKLVEATGERFGRATTLQHKMYLCRI